MFEVLLTIEVLLCLMLGAGMVRLLAELSPAPELDLGQRAWAAARFGMAEAAALGPLFRHLTRSAREGLQLSHRLQEQIRGERARQQAIPPLAPVLGLWQRWRVQRSAELAELAHLVEQLEQMSRAIARYRAGRGRLMELKVPMSCIAAVSRSAKH